jgi:hypothetical protein
MAASVELQSPARETRYGTWVLNAITDNLVDVLGRWAGDGVAGSPHSSGWLC